MYKKTVKNDETGTPLLDYLQHHISVAPAGYLRQLIRAGKAGVNGNPGRPDQALRPGDVVTLPQSKRLQHLLDEAERSPQVLYESDEILVVRKPHTLATHSSKGHEHDNLVDRVSRMLHEQNKKFRIAAIHRLDLPTSGPVIFGKGQKAISTLGRLMQEDGIRKRYLALVKSGLPNRGLLSGQVSSKGKLKYAETGFCTICARDGYALLDLDLRTGRQHQIRKQLAERGFPIAGDRRYRGPMPGNLTRLFLHCHHLSFNDPSSGETIQINDPLPQELSETLIALNLAIEDSVLCDPDQS